MKKLLTLGFFIIFISISTNAWSHGPAKGMGPGGIGVTQFSKKDKLEILTKTEIIKKIMLAYLDTKGNHTYEFKQEGPLSFEITPKEAESYEFITQMVFIPGFVNDFPFAKDSPPHGTITFYPSEGLDDWDWLTKHEFEVLRKEFNFLLRVATALLPDNPRIAGLIVWGKSSQVTFPDEDTSYSIIPENATWFDHITTDQTNYKEDENSDSAQADNASNDTI